MALPLINDPNTPVQQTPLGGQSLDTPEGLKMRRALALEMMKTGTDYSPVRSPWQGAARMANALVGGLMNNKISADEMSGDDRQRAFYAEVLSRGGATPAAAPVAAPAPISQPMGALPTMGASPKVLGAALSKDTTLPNEVAFASDMNAGLPIDGPSPFDKYAGLDAGMSQDLMRAQAALKNRGLVTALGETTRSPEQQNNYFAQGRTAPGPIITNARAGQSPHQYGMATDIIPVNMPERQAATVMQQAYAAGDMPGLQTGANFPGLSDPFHVQAANWKQQAQQRPVQLASNAPSYDGSIPPCASSRAAAFRRPPRSNCPGRAPG